MKVNDLPLIDLESRIAMHKKVMMSEPEDSQAYHLAARALRSYREVLNFIEAKSVKSNYQTLGRVTFLMDLYHAKEALDERR